MNGQWIRPYTGTNNGTLVLELDDVGNEYEGVAFAYNSSRDQPTIFAELKIQKAQPKQSVRVQLPPIERGSGVIISPENLAKIYPTLTPATYADTEWDISPSQISLRWITNIGTNGTAQVLKSEAANDSDLVSLPTISTWKEFKEYAATLTPCRFLFRGQENNKWKLRTSFHRTGRASIPKFSIQDMTALHRHLSGMTAHRFDLGNALDNAAFLNLVQHHGYPTPLLDWMQSPFIAAYFAYRNLLRDAMRRIKRSAFMFLTGELGISITSERQF
jgi:FRG domain-containing protein